MKRVWFNTALVKGKLPLASDERGLTLGDGVFETLAVRDGVAIMLEQHLGRMAEAALALGIAFPLATIKKAAAALTINANGLHVLRLTLTRGPGGRGLAGDTSKPTLIGSLQPFDEALRFKPVTLATSSIRRNLHSPSSRLKTTSYADNILAAREAHALGAEDALMLNTKGRVASSSIGNIFLIRGGEIATPSLGEAILPGITRGLVLRLAREAGLRAREKQLTLKDLAQAEQAFVTNSLRLLRPIVSIDGRALPAQSKLLDSLMRGLFNAEQDHIQLK